MIYISKIIGESYDFSTGEETEKSLVITNGMSEIAIPVSNEILKMILQLHMEEHPPEKEDSGEVDEVDDGEIHGEESEVYNDLYTGATSI